MSLWALLPAAASLAGTLLSRPKKKDYIYDTSYMDKYINNLRGQRIDSQISHMIMQPALRAIGQQGARFGRQIDQYTARRKPGGGVEAQMRLSGSQQSLEAIGKAGEKAFFEQFKENRRVGNLIGRIEMEKGRMESIGKREFSRAKSQWNKDVITGGLGLAATAGASIAATNKANNDILEKAKALDLVDDDMGVKEFSQLGANQGFKNTALFTDQLARDRGIDQALNVFDPSNIPTNDAIDAKVRSGDWSTETGREAKKAKLNLEGEIRDYKYFDPANEKDLTRDDIISARESGYITSEKAEENIDIIDANTEMKGYVKGFAKGQIALKEYIELFPDDPEGAFDLIQGMDIPGKMKLDLIAKTATSYSKLLTSWQKEVLGTYTDKNSTSDDLRPHMFKKGATFDEAKWVAGRIMDKARIEAEGKGKAGEKYVKVAEGKLTAQLTRRRLLLSQPQLVNDPAFKYVTDFLDIKTEADLVSLGQNLAGVQDRLSKLAEKAEIPATLPGFSDLYGSEFTKADVEAFEGFNSVEKVKYLKQKWQDDIMDEISKALKVVGFPGVMNPETFLGITSVGVLPQMVGTPKNEIPEDLSIWE